MSDREPLCAERGERPNQGADQTGNCFTHDVDAGRALNTAQAIENMATALGCDSPSIGRFPHARRASGPSLDAVGIQYRKRVQVGRKTAANLSTSGVSLSRSAGPVTLNSRGRASVRVAPGWSFRLGKGTTGNAALVMLALSAVVLVVWLSWAALRLVWLAVFLPARWALGKLAARSSA